MQGQDDNSERKATVSLEEREKGSKTGWRGTRGKLEWRLTSNRLDNNPQIDVVEDFFNILAQAENTACSDTHEMIRLKNGIAEMSCAREKEKETRKSGLARGKHGEITLLDTHV